MNDELRERLAKRYYRERWTDDAWETLRPAHKAAYYETVDAILAEIEAAGKVIMDRDRAERLIAYAVADQEYAQASTWAGIWSDDEVERKAVELQYAGREKRRREARRAIMLGDLDPLEGGE